MPLSWNEIRQRAIAFANAWKGETREDAERQTFWNEFFEVFGISRRTVASFEEPVKLLSGNWGSIDLFWPGKMLAEHKSAGKDLSKAHAQAMEYIRGLKDSGREREAPRYVIVTDFARIALHDLEPADGLGRGARTARVGSLRAASLASASTIEFPLTQLHQHVRHFAWIAGYQQHRLDPEDPANEEAVALMCDLHDALQAGGYRGHDLKRFLVRVLFCLFADDTGIFPPRAFELWLQDRTAADGSDLGPQLDHLFRVLNTPEEKRQDNLDESLRLFPYVNGELFAERLEFAAFNSDMRNRLLACCRFRWERISPAVFGSLFQSVMEPKERRQIGAHYTAEKNILKLIRSLFLDDFREEFKVIKADRSTRRRARLEEFQAQLARLRFLDPACGCGNFLVIAYRELRQLELEVLIELHGAQREMALDEVNKLSRLDVDQFSGIEIEEFPARIAEVALGLTDHQMNQQVGVAFSQNYQRIPLCKNPHIVVANALRTDWSTVLPAQQCTHVLGNPPFVGKKEQNAGQKADLNYVWGDAKGTGILDFVTCWYRKAAEYIQGTQIHCAFVSTNSISQGEQVGVMWSELLRRYHLKIHFAHTTFAWESEARGKAHVHVVIIGFGAFDIPNKVIFEYDTPRSEAHALRAKNINPYLADAPDVVLTSRSRPINGAPQISYGSMMIDKDRKADDEEGLLLTPQYRNDLLAECPALAPYIRRIYGGDEFLNSTERYCLWLVDAPPSLIHNCASLRKRIEGVRRFREGSGREQTRELAATPTLFGEIRQPNSTYLLFPKVSSESRRYLPIGFVTPDIIASGSALIVPTATLYHFGVLSSAMHNALMRRVAGRMKSDYQYSNAIVYNNYPWPEGVSAEQRGTIEAAVRSVLKARTRFRNSTLAELYSPLSMPAPLLKAHRALDRLVDRAYRKEPFASDRQRVEFLFQLYEKLTAPLVAAAKPKRVLPVPAAKPLPRGRSTPQSEADAAHFYCAKEEPTPYRTEEAGGNG